MSIRFSDGIIVFVEGDKKDEWFLAKSWQKKQFVKFMRFGTMKSMGHPGIHEESEPFTEESYNYKYHVYNDWNPCVLENLDTGKKRTVRYFELYNNIKSNNYTNKLSRITYV